MKSKIYLIFLPGIFIFLPPISAQTFHNLHFSQRCDSSKTGFCFWDLSWGKNAVSPDSQAKNTLRITGETENSVGFAEQTVLISPQKNISILSLSAMVRSGQVVGKGAGLNIGLYNAAGQLISNKDMGGFYSVSWIQGTNPWKRFSISIVVPVETVKIKIGAILYGKGMAWFKELAASLSDVGKTKPSWLARQYISDVCDTIQMHSLVRDSIDINQLKTTALAIAGNARKFSDCYLAVNYLLESLRPHGDHHSFFMTPEELKNWENQGSQVSRIEYPTMKIIETVGYINVPAFHGGNKKQILDFADSLQKGIQRLYNSNIKGWIVDLRQNTGGNMAPMVAGLGPLFSQDKLGALEDVNGKQNAWYYKNGNYFWDDDPGFSVTNPVALAKKLPIAVLTSGQTGSSGEAVVVSFIGNDNTKLFGQPTWGLTTGNGNFKLKDGGQVFLASTIYTDRDGNRYSGKITPDIIIETSPSTQEDKDISAAAKWITSR